MKYRKLNTRLILWRIFSTTASILGLNNSIQMIILKQDLEFDCTVNTISLLFVCYYEIFQMYV